MCIAKDEHEWRYPRNRIITVKNSVRGGHYYNHDGDLNDVTSQASDNDELVLPANDKSSEDHGYFSYNNVSQANKGQKISERGSHCPDQTRAAVVHPCKMKRFLPGYDLISAQRTVRGPKDKHWQLEIKYRHSPHHVALEENRDVQLMKRKIN